MPSLRTAVVGLSLCALALGASGCRKRTLQAAPPAVVSPSLPEPKPETKPEATKPETPPETVPATHPRRAGRGRASHHRGHQLGRAESPGSFRQATQRRSVRLG